MCIGGYRDNFQRGGKCFGVLETGDFLFDRFLDTGYNMLNKGAGR